MSGKGLLLFIVGMFYGSWMSTGDGDPVRIALASFGVTFGWLAGDKLGRMWDERSKP